MPIGRKGDLRTVLEDLVGGRDHAKKQGLHAVVLHAGLGGRDEFMPESAERRMSLLLWGQDLLERLGVGRLHDLDRGFASNTEDL